MGDYLPQYLLRGLTDFFLFIEHACNSGIFLALDSL